MKYFKFSKLVRDKIIDSMNENKQYPRGVHVLNNDEYVKELIKKVIEETEEMQQTSNIDELKKELADVQEVIDYIKNIVGISNDELKKLQKHKIEKNGGFEKRIYVEDVGVANDSEWYSYYISNSNKYPEVKE